MVINLSLSLALLSLSLSLSLSLPLFHSLLSSGTRITQVIQQSYCIIEHISNIFCVQLVSRSLYLAQHLILLFHILLFQYLYVYIPSSVDMDHRFIAELSVPGTVCGNLSIGLHRSDFRVVMNTEAISMHFSNGYLSVFQSSFLPCFV